MSEHTPGPWQWSAKCNTENRSLTGTDQHTDQYGKHVPIVYLHEGYRSEAEKQANTNLIAAAPDLLQACKNALTTLRVMSMPQLDNNVANNEELTQIMKTSLQAAIAKASNS